MRFRFYDEDLSSTLVVSVDGIAPCGPNFSHWPGNRTPPELKHDLSTGIVLGLVDRPARDRDRWLGRAELVTNTHYDTDGVLSAFALLEPEFALARRAAFLDAARTGDFQVFTTEGALRIDLALTALGDQVPDDLPTLDRRQAQYERAFAALPGLFENPAAPLPDDVERECAQVLADVARARSPAVTIRRHAAAGLAVVVADPPLHRVALNTAAGDLFRVLAITPCGSGHLYRYHDRVESWFDVVSFTPPRRVPLEPLAARLDALEASETDPRWLCHDIAMPVPECWFGELGTGRSLGPGTPGALCVSRLTPRIVERAVAEEVWSPES